MSNGSMRPGGLMALAICNFLFAGLAGLNVLGLVVFLTMAAPRGGQTPRGMPSEMMLIAMVALGAVGGVLLVLSGIGYIMTKKFLGRVLGTIYGLLALSSSIFAIVVFTNAGGDVGLLNLVGIIYPVLTIVLLNTTFRNDFVN